MFSNNSIFRIFLIIMLFLMFFNNPIIPQKSADEFAHSSIDASNANSNNDTSDTLEMEVISYIHSVLKFKSLSVEELKLKLNNDDAFILYVGRATCQWCRKVAPILCCISSEQNLNIFYLDSENTESNPNLQEFRNNHEIDTVPAIIVFYNQDNYKIINFDVTADNDSLKKQLEKELLFV